VNTKARLTIGPGDGRNTVFTVHGAGCRELNSEALVTAPGRIAFELGNHGVAVEVCGICAGADDPPVAEDEYCVWVEDDGKRVLVHLPGCSARAGECVDVWSFTDQTRGISYANDYLNALADNDPAKFLRVEPCDCWRLDLRGGVGVAWDDRWADARDAVEGTAWRSEG
jgi:hypothetical protein